VAEDLKRIYRAVNGKEAKKSEKKLKYFRYRWVKTYPKLTVWWEEHFDANASFCSFPHEIRSKIYIANQLERLNKELKRRLKVMEVLPEEERAEKILYLILREPNERYQKRKLRGFEAILERYTEEISSSVREEVIAQAQLS
jgi:transposase-like protein